MALNFFLEEVHVTPTHVPLPKVSYMPKADVNGVGIYNFLYGGAL